MTFMVTIVVVVRDVNEASKVRGRGQGRGQIVPQDRGGGRGQGQKKLQGQGWGRTLWGWGQRCRINYKLLIWIQPKKYCNSSHDNVKW